MLNQTVITGNLGDDPKEFFSAEGPRLKEGYRVLSDFIHADQIELIFLCDSILLLQDHDYNW